MPVASAARRWGLKLGLIRPPALALAPARRRLRVAHATAGKAPWPIAVHTSLCPRRPGGASARHHSKSTGGSLGAADDALAALVDVAPTLFLPSGVPYRALVLCGPSGVGKSYLLGALRARLPDKLGFCVSHTSREPRTGEVDGVHYHFVGRAEIDAMEQAGKLLECDTVHDNMYATSIAAVEDVHRAGKACVMDISIQGAVQFVEACSVWQNGLGMAAPVCVYVRPPSLDALDARLRHRGTETDTQIQVRLANAAKEADTAASAGIWDLELVKHWV